MKKVALGLVTPFPVLAGESGDDAAIFFLETTLQLYKNSRGGKQIAMRYAGLRMAAFGRFSQIKIWMTIDSPTPPPLSLLLFPEPTVVLTVVPGAYCCSSVVQRL